MLIKAVIIACCGKFYFCLEIELLFYTFQVSLVWPVIYLLFWAFLLVFSLYSEPVVCGIGIAIMLTGIPVYLLCVYWDSKPKSFNFAIGNVFLYA